MIGNKGITLIVGVLFAATAIVAYWAPLSGDEKVTITLVGTLITLVVADLLKSRLYGSTPPGDPADNVREQNDHPA